MFNIADHEQQRIQTLVNPTGSDLSSWQRLALKGVLKRQAVCSADAQHRPEDGHGRRHQKTTWIEVRRTQCLCTLSPSPRIKKTEDSLSPSPTSPRPSPRAEPRMKPWLPREMRWKRRWISTLKTSEPYLRHRKPSAVSTSLNFRPACRRKCCCSTK